MTGCEHQPRSVMTRCIKVLIFLPCDFLKQLSYWNHEHVSVEKTKWIKYFSSTLLCCWVLADIHYYGHWFFVLVFTDCPMDGINHSSNQTSNWSKLYFFFLQAKKRIQVHYTSIYFDVFGSGYFMKAVTLSRNGREGKRNVFDSN
jgi:hypothetical protein